MGDKAVDPRVNGSDGGSINRDVMRPNCGFGERKREGEREGEERDEAEKKTRANTSSTTSQLQWHAALRELPVVLARHNLLVGKFVRTRDDTGRHGFNKHFLS